MLGKVHLRESEEAAVVPTEYVNLPFHPRLHEFSQRHGEFPSVSKANSVVLAWVFRLWLIVSLLFLFHVLMLPRLSPR